MSDDLKDQEEKRLLPLRQQIDAVDQEIIKLLSDRAKIALAVGAVKHEYGSPVFRPEREKQVLEKLAQRNPGPLKTKGLQAIWQEVMSACRDIEGSISVAYLGPAGTFSEEATLQFFGQSTQLVPCSSLDEVFAQVENETVQYGVLPIENSSEGAISRTLDLLLESNLIISGEIAIPIKHSLLSLSGTLEGITQVSAHAQALAQCQQWLTVNTPQLQRQALSSNAQAAKEAALNPHQAAIASSSAATQYGLKVIQQGIQDDAHNRTRFIVVGKQACLPSGSDQTSLILSVANEPGAVYKMLTPLAKHDVSMTRFESRPARKGTWEYHFYIDIDGHQKDAKVAEALKELLNTTAFFKCLGSYPKSNPTPKNT